MSDLIPTTQEQWRPIAGFTAYSVSNFGNVRRDVGSKYNNRIGQLKALKNASPYLMVSLYNETGQHLKAIHRLVLEAFYGLDPSRPYCNHKNGIKWDNRLENLEWSTPSENTQHCFRVLGRVGNRGEKCKSHKITAKEVVEIRNARRAGIKGSVLAKQYGITEMAICDIWIGRNWRHIPGYKDDKTTCDHC